ncbi:pentapeptide repeat-containing protein [Paenibacillus sp. NPDC057967]|uniref:pentapeptide repeat-containing protein n=1 Tax=Paenibacillus sp. NPDC057967 TaxID=3346293 RepID=UPI0036DC21DC
MSSDMRFIGKWALRSASVSSYISLDGSGKLVAVNASTPGGNQRFNGYGNTSSGFWLQGNNGKYVAYKGSGYTAAEPRTGSPALFMLETSGASVRLVEQASGTRYYVNVSGSTVSRVPVNNPPASTLLNQEIISRGLADIQASKMAINNDLTWAYMASADLNRVSFIDSNLSDADLSACNVYGAVFPNATTNLTRVNFSGATMSYAVMNQVTMPGANLTNSTMLNTKLSDANLEGSNFTGANMTKALLLNARVQNGNLTDANLSEALIRNARFDNANLTRADLRKASVDDIHLPGATLVSAKLDELDLRTAQIDAKTNFAGASMQKVRLIGCSLSKVTFTRADLTEALLDNSDLTGADFSYANLTKAKLTGGVKLYSASLSNSTLTSADFTGAQLGAKEASFTMNKSLAPDLNSGAITSGVRTAFQNGGHTLSGSATLEARIPNENWVIIDVNTIYTITNNGSELIVWVYSDVHDAAVLAGAYMPNAVFTNANLYAVDMSGVNWYGASAKANNADLEDVNLSNANLGSMDFTQARMYGCTLSQAILIETIFNGAYLRPSVSKKPASLTFANMQGASFIQAHLQGAVLTNAAVSLDQGPFFTVPMSYASGLNNGTISSDLRTQFQTHNYPLASNATVTVNIPNSSWTILNGSDPVYPVYNIAEVNQKLNVSGRPFGVHLFDMVQSVSTDLDRKNVSQAIKDAFSNNGYPLLPSANIDQVIVPGSFWHMKNIESDTSKLQNGYSEFYVLNSTDDNMLHVYARVLMIIRTGANHELENVRIALPTTQLTQNDMDRSTTCPNGMRLSRYLDQRPPERITWEQMMTPAAPPKPPVCVPSPDHWCP